MSQETAFPQCQVDVNGEVVLMPFGEGCVCCIEATEIGMSYMTFEEVAIACKESPNFQQICQQLSESHARGELTPWQHSNSTVHSNKTFYRQLACKFDGYTKEEFLEEFHPCTPESLGVPACLETHPITKEEVPVFYVPSMPSFQLTCASAGQVKWNTNKMVH